jgi:hypothetical protein
LGIQSIEAAATTQSLSGFRQARLDDIIDVHNVFGHLLMEELCPSRFPTSTSRWLCLASSLWTVLDAALLASVAH